MERNGFLSPVLGYPSFEPSLICPLELKWFVPVCTLQLPGVTISKLMGVCHSQTEWVFVHGASPTRRCSGRRTT